MKIVRAKSEFDWHRKRAKPFVMLMKGKADVRIVKATHGTLEVSINGRGYLLVRPPMKGV